MWRNSLLSLFHFPHTSVLYFVAKKSCDPWEPTKEKNVTESWFAGCLRTIACPPGVGCRDEHDFLRIFGQRNAWIFLSSSSLVLLRVKCDGSLSDRDSAKDMCWPDGVLAGL